VRLSECPASSCSMSSLMLAAMTSLAVWALGVEGRVAMLLVSFEAEFAVHCGSPFLNGCAVFAHKHALALAHASRGGKCKRRGISHPCRGAEAERKGRPQAGLHKRNRGTRRVLFPLGW
jgi:hypothetical protein